MTKKILFCVFWFLPLAVLMLETKWGKRKMVNERDRFADELMSYSCAVIGLAASLALILA